MYYQIPLTWDVGRKGGTRYAVRYLDGVPLYGAAMRCGHRQAGRGYGSGTHRGCGSDHAGDQYHRADVLLERCFILWGRPAQSKKPMIYNSKHLILESAHPSPLSAYRGFFGSRPFSRTNEYLKENGLAPIDWQIENRM